MNRIKNLDQRFENILEDYYRDQYGTKSIPARWKKCIDFVNGNLGTAVSALYVRKYFDLESKQKVSESMMVAILTLRVFYHLKFFVFPIHRPKK